MNIENFRDYCLAKKFVTESFPFDETTLVLKVLNKIFALTDLEESFKITLKAKPKDIILLTEKFETISGAYHMNKKHWLTIEVDGSLPDEFIKKRIDDSYNSVVAGMPKKQQKLINAQ